MFCTFFLFCCQHCFCCAKCFVLTAIDWTVKFKRMNFICKARNQVFEFLYKNSSDIHFQISPETPCQQHPQRSYESNQKAPITSSTCTLNFLKHQSTRDFFLLLLFAVMKTLNTSPNHTFTKTSTAKELSFFTTF